MACAGLARMACVWRSNICSSTWSILEVPARQELCSRHLLPKPVELLIQRLHSCKQRVGVWLK